MNSENDKERGTGADPDATTAFDRNATRDSAAGVEQAARPGTADVQAYIGRQLRAVYDDVVKQPIPDRFLDLMKQLEEQGRSD